MVFCLFIDTSLVVWMMVDLVHYDHIFCSQLYQQIYLWRMFVCTIRRSSSLSLRFRVHRRWRGWLELELLLLHRYNIDQFLLMLGLLWNLFGYWRQREQHRCLCNDSSMTSGDIRIQHLGQPGQHHHELIPTLCSRSLFLFDHLCNLEQLWHVPWRQDLQPTNEKDLAILKVLHSFQQHVFRK